MWHHPRGMAMDDAQPVEAALEELRSPQRRALVASWKPGPPPEAPLPVPESLPTIHGAGEGKVVEEGSRGSPEQTSCQRYSQPNRVTLVAHR